MRKIVIGITGGIASGKSQVRLELEKLGCLGIDADRVGHEIMLPGKPAYDRLISRYDSKILSTKESREIDRKKLGAIVFADKDELRWLESVTHPAIISEIQSLIDASDAPIALEAVKLMQSSLKEICDQKWLVSVPAEVQVQRLQQARGMTAAEARARVQSQQLIDWDEKEFDLVLDGSMPLALLAEKIHLHWAELQKY
jgi:dephospho-CoA kinase